MTCRNTFLFIPRNGILCPQFFGIYLFHPLDIAKNESFLEGFAPPATLANHRSVSMVLGFILAKTLCPQRHSKVWFKLLKAFWVTPKRHCPRKENFSEVDLIGPRLQVLYFFFI